jgi:ribokinase
VPMETVLHALRVAKRHGRRVILNPAPATPVPDDALPMVDFLTPNETEAEMLLGGGAAGLGGIAATAEALRAKGAGTVITTLGREGAYVVSPEGSFHVAGRHVEAVDTTAAGDAFTGALACALAESRKLPDALAFATAAAALSVTRIGAQSSLPDRAAVEAFL